MTSTGTPVPALEGRLAPPELRSRRHRRADGLDLLAVHVPQASLTQFVLRVPWGALTPAEYATAMVLGQTLLAGTPARTGRQVAMDLQAAGTKVDVVAQADHLLVMGVCAPPWVDRMIATAAAALASAAYPDSEVARARHQIAHEVAVAVGDPSAAAYATTLRTRFGAHPGAMAYPTAAAIAAVTPDAVRRLHRDRLVGPGSTLVVLGAGDPQELLDTVLGRLGELPTRPVPAAPAPAAAPAPEVRLVHRPGALQAGIALATRSVARSDRLHAAAELVNLVYGGYFSSRLVSVLREDKGYSYAPSTRLIPTGPAPWVLATATVSASVAAHALEVVQDELSRLRSDPPSGAELAAVRSFATGSLAMRVARPETLGRLLSGLAADGLEPSWLAEHHQALLCATRHELDEVIDLALDPTGITTVVAGDADVVGPALRERREVIEVEL